MYIKNTNLGKNKFLYLILIIIINFLTIFAYSEDEIYFGRKVDVQILDKLSSKNKLIKINIGEEFIFKNLVLKVLKCKNSKFDDNPEITSYLQVKDTNNQNNNDVFVFNGWTFSSSVTLRTFDHPVYDLWLTGCENI